MDDEPDAHISERRRIMENALGQYGWDPVKGARNDIGTFDCDLDIRAFYAAAEELKDDLESGRYLADTEADIVALTTVFESHWWRFVDPRLSQARISPVSRSVVVLWECGVHMVALSDRGNGTWLARSGVANVLDLLDTLDHEAALAAEMHEPELVDDQKLSELLETEDLERRRLLTDASRALLEDPDEQ